MDLKIDYQFNYNAKKNVILFKFDINGNGFAVGLDAPVFLALIDDIVKLAAPFLAEVKYKIAKGIKEDIKAEFNQEAWNKKMGWDKKEEDDGR